MTSTEWLARIKSAKKRATIKDGKKIIHYAMTDGKEMIEEYNIETNVLVRRAWRKKGDILNYGDWETEVGHPESKGRNLEECGILESAGSPFLIRRITKTSLEWRIRNLPYPIDMYSVTAEKDGTITLRTNNKKYYKKITVPELQRVGLNPEQDRISFMHKNNTLIIVYTKPPAVLELEKKVLEEISQIKVEDHPSCPVN